jgi:hypothetical protein
MAITLLFASQMRTFITTKHSTGIVYGANGPLAGAYVVASPSSEGGNGSSYAFTDGSGHYSMTTGLTAGSYNVSASAYGYITDQISFVNVTTGQTTSGADIDLQLSGGISGKVTDAVSGDPINATGLYAVLSTGAGTVGWWYGISGPDGSYLIATNLVTGTYNVTIGLPPDGYFRQMTTASVVAGVETKNVDLHLDRSGILSGKVMMPNGTGLFGIDVTAISSDGVIYFGFATTDSSGNYRIATGLGTANYTVYASGAGNSTAYGGLFTPTPVLVTAGQETSGIDMELTPVTTPPMPSGVITGRITDQDSNPVRSASVSALGSGGFGFGETDDNGYYNISSGLGNGNDYNVSATATGYFDAYYPTLVTVTIGQTTPNINIVMTAQPPETFGTITGTVTGAPNPIPEFQDTLIEMLTLTLATVTVCGLTLKVRRSRNKLNLL